MKAVYTFKSIAAWKVQSYSYQFFISSCNTDVFYLSVREKNNTQIKLRCVIFVFLPDIEFMSAPSSNMHFGAFLAPQSIFQVELIGLLLAWNSREKVCWLENM